MLYHADCFDIFPQIPNNSIDLVLTDMPYGTTACKWDTALDLERMWKELKRICKGTIVLTSIQPFTSTLVSSNINQFKYCWYWKKSKATGHLNAKIQPLRNIEDICIFYDKLVTYNPQYAEGTPYSGRTRKEHTGTYSSHGSKREDNPGIRYPNQVLEIQGVNKPVHPTQKPVALMEYLIKTYSNEGDTVLDFCMGSGTTGVACRSLNRNFIGIEKELKYYDIAKERINK